MWPHFVNFFLRILHGMPLLVSSNWLAWGLGISAFIFYEVATLIVRGWGDMRARLKQNLGLGVLATTLTYMVLFIWSSIRTASDDHHDVTGRWQAVVKEKDQLKRGLTDRDNEIAALQKQVEDVKKTHRINPVAIQVSAPAMLDSIHDVVAEVRLTCVLTNPNKMPDDELLAMSDEDSYLEGGAGKSYLQSQTHTYKRAEEEGKAVSIEYFKVPPNSDLIGRPISSLANYSILHLINTGVSNGRFSECIFVEVTLRVNGSDVFRDAEAIRQKLDAIHGLSFDVKLTGMNLPK
jgi:hypothetical protein